MGTRARATLLVAAILICACSTPPATAPASHSAGPPSAEPTTGPSKSPWVAITPTPTSPRLPAPTDGPHSSCAALGLVLSPTFEAPDVDIDAGSRFPPLRIPLDVVRVASTSDPDAVWTGAPDDDELQDVASLPGGRELEVSLAPDYDFPWPWPVHVHAVSASLRIPGQGRRAIEARWVNEAASPATVLLALPDINATGYLELDVEVSDRCFTYAARGRGPVRIVARAIVDGCPRSHEGFAAHWAALGEPPFQVGDVPVDLERIETVGLWTPYAVSSQGNDGLSTWDQTVDAAVAIAGETLPAAEANLDLRLQFLYAEFYRRKAVVGWLDGGDRPSRVFRATAEPYPDGHLELLVPTNPGRYVASLHIQWESPCAYGGAVGAVGINVE